MIDQAVKPKSPPAKPKTKEALPKGEGRRAIRLLLAFTRRHRRWFVLGLLMLTLEAVTAVYEPYPLAYLIDFLKQGGVRAAAVATTRRALHFPGISSPEVATIAVLTLAIVAIAMVNSLCDSMAEIYLARGGRLLGFNIRNSLYSHLQRLSLAFHNQRRTGDVLTRVTGDVTAVEEFVVQSLSDIAGSILVLVGTMVFLAFHSWQISVMALFLVPLLSVVSNFFSKRIKKTAKRQRAKEGDLASQAQEMLTSIRVIQTYGRGRFEQERFVKSSQEAMSAALTAAGLEARFSWVVSVMEAVVVSVIVWAGRYLVVHRSISVGTLILFIILIQNMFKPTKRIIKEWTTIGKVYASVERIGDLLDRKPSVEDLPTARPAPPLAGHVEFRQVSFAYTTEPSLGAAGDGGESPAARLAIDDVSFTVQRGEVIALVGPSGAGKSTLAQMVPRLYDPHDGQVLIDGWDIREFTLESLRAQIGMVLQDTILFTGSVAYNIGYGRENATQEEIVEAAKLANAHDFITNMPEGYNTELGERAQNLSGGQRQRVAIARALVRNAPILMLDEPTTGLDAESTDLVLEALKRLMKGKTTLIISHDLNLIRDADKIIVIKAGVIAEQGTHDQLLDAGGLYANLYERQFGLPERDREPERVPALVGAARDEDEDEDEEDDAPKHRVFETMLMQALPVPAPPQAFQRARALSRVHNVVPGDGGGTADQAAGGPEERGPRRKAIFKTMALGALRPQAPAASPAEVDPSELDARRSPELRRRFPGLDAALHADTMRDRLQATLFEPDSQQVIERCIPGKAIYAGGDEARLRYQLDVMDRTTGTVWHPLVSARLFGSDAAAGAFDRDRLQPLRARAAGRPEVAGFGSPVGAVPGVAAAVHAFPIDPDIPTLLDATDPGVMAQMFRRTLPGAVAGHVTVDACEVEVAHYPRRFRCVLRYRVTGRRSGTGDPRALLVYGKTYALGQDYSGEAVVDELRQRLEAGPGGPPFVIPHSAGFVPQLRLALLEGIPGSPFVNGLVKARAGGDPVPPGAEGLSLEAAVDACASIVAAMHASGARLGTPRPLEDELAGLDRELRELSQISPSVAGGLVRFIAQLTHEAGASSPLPPAFCHGDFTHAQVIFDDERTGLVDFDNVCQAEPALDLGQFLAYLRVAIRKAERARGSGEGLGESLRGRFVDRYLAGLPGLDRSRLSARIGVYEKISLIRMAVHGWQQMKPARVANVLSVLEETSS